MGCGGGGGGGGQKQAEKMVARTAELGMVSGSALPLAFIVPKQTITHATPIEEMEREQKKQQRRQIGGEGFLCFY